MSLWFYPKSHRYKMTDADGEKKWVRGVTGLVGGGIDKPGIPHWAAKKTAEYVHANPLEIERLRGLPDVYHHRDGYRPALVDELLKVHQQELKKAQDRGTELHTLAEDYINGQEVVIPDEHAAEVEGIVEFIERLQLTPMLTEVSVGNRAHWFAGRLDFVGTSPFLCGGAPVLIDWKSSRDVHGETALQLAAYASAEFYANDDTPDVEVPLPKVAATYVAHITPGRTDLHDGFPAGADQIAAAFQQFLACAYTTKMRDVRDAYAKSIADLDALTAPERSAAA